jgi:serine/threonine protein kinase
MTPERWKEIKEMFAVALAKPPQERAAYLDQACTQPALRREVEALIAAHDLESSTFVDAGRESHEILRDGAKVGPYEILAPLGAGGMGVVYRARDSRLEREVAIKFIASGVLANGAARSRFRKEALALAKLNHQNIAGVYDVGTADGAEYLVMEYVPGQSLSQKLKSGPLTPVEAMSLGEEIAAALQEAHERGIVHRDLKPANIIVTPRGHAKVLDFGLAKLLSVTDRDETKTFSESRGLVGTPLYMSPEQAEGAVVDLRTDLWSLGAVLYESMTGRPPFEGNGLALMRAITEKKPKTLQELRSDTPPEAEQIVSRALEKDKAKRYQ